MLYKQKDSNAVCHLFPSQMYLKPHVFDDFITCAQYLIDKKYTSQKKLVIEGGSNGGLLVGAVTNQRPELFGCLISNVGLLDMIRFSKFTTGSSWCRELGNPDIEEDYKYIIKYSPLHNIEICSFVLFDFIFTKKFDL